MATEYSVPNRASDAGPDTDGEVKDFEYWITEAQCEVRRALTVCFTDAAVEAQQRKRALASAIDALKMAEELV